MNRGNASGAQNQYPINLAASTNRTYPVLDHRTCELREMNWTSTGTCPGIHEWPGNALQWKLHATHMKEICND